MRNRIIMFAALLPLAAACAPTDGPRAPDVRAPAAKVVGEPVDCLSTNRIRTTHVHDDYTIDFETTDGKTYRNTLANRCPTLGFEERFGYEVSVGQLCSIDIIHVLDSNGRSGASCGLGPFVPVEIEKP
jgi:hypothetical protein